MGWYLLLAFALGVAVPCIWIACRNVGTMQVYIPNDPDDMPYVAPDFSKGANFIRSKKYIVFKVETKHLNSRD